MPGFERCYLVDMAPQTGVRQTRLLEGEHVMSKEDVMQRTRFADSVARGRDYYYPYRAMLPRGVENLLVAGRHYSATSAAQKISREIPPCMAMGEAAGVAAALALDAGVSVRNVDVGAVQRVLRAQGADPGDQSGAESGRAGAGPRRGRSRGGGMNAAATGLPLDGIRVIDFTQVMMGPVCTQMLADHGADVIKIERKGAGDLSRSTFEPVAGQDNPIFCSLNRNKRSVEIDLRDPAQVALVKALIADADVVINNFRAGVMERMGLGYEDCRRINPRIIYAVGTGFGETGPYAHKGGQDVLAQALSGVMARRADDELPLSIYPTALADYTAGMHMVQGILFALLQRERTGVGQKVSVSLYNSMLAMQMQEAAMIMMADSEVNWAAMPLSGVFETKTGALVAGRRVQGQSAARHLHRARPARPLARRALQLRWSSSSSTSPSCTACSASASRATRASTGWPASRSRTCSRRRCATCARRSSTRRRCTTT